MIWKIENADIIQWDFHVDTVVFFRVTPKTKLIFSKTDFV